MTRANPAVAPTSPARSVGPTTREHDLAADRIAQEALTNVEQVVRAGLTALAG